MFKILINLLLVIQNVYSYCMNFNNNNSFKIVMFADLYYDKYLCYNGGSGLHPYGKVDWKRRSRILHITDEGKSIYTWKRLYDNNLTLIDLQKF